MKDILAARYWATVDYLSRIYELDYAREQAHRIVLDQIVAEAYRAQELLAEIHEEGTR